ncbi:hemicentin-1-like isoform X2 [Coregonus clupeaformis]|uniref:hemicentin-1-like isoform X2 n=1 Tax=Coregonus clupeaformis TaxID=59861 RepID=UPI001E1C2DE1|nr:hemicentin-1-like isoform X2 [Coregonus clupeaformis]
MVKGILEFLTLGVLVFTGRPTHASSPLELNPPRLVVRYGDSVSVNCSTSSTDHEGMGWEATYGGTGFEQNVNIVTWTVDNLTDWTIEPKCYITLNDGNQLIEVLPVILYKTPDSVSISVLSHSGPMVEGTEYQLQCDIQNIAPQQNLVVKWYKGNEPVDNVTYSNIIKTPVNVSATLMISPSRDDDGAQYRCRAELDLGPEGPQPHPTVTSEPLNITVHYPPTFSRPEAETLDIRVGEKITLNCTATGRPTPLYSWQSSDVLEALFTPSSELPGTYTCTASNLIGKNSKTFTVNPKPKGGRTTFYAIIGSGLGLALLVGIGYLFLKQRAGRNSII